MRYTEYFVTVKPPINVESRRKYSSKELPSARMSIEGTISKSPEEVGKNLAQLAKKKKILSLEHINDFDDIWLFRAFGKKHLSVMRSDPSMQGHGGLNGETNLGERNAAIFMAFKEHATAIINATAS